MLAIIATLVTGAVAVAVLAGSSAARTRAQSAADLAVLGAATSAMYGDAPPCETARETALRNGAVQVSCEDEGAGVFTISVQAPAPAGRTARATARAGPASAAP
ncbi:helicase/secretion neighborhood TadE-like protein [Sanguibacter gelidistatuariae]|uniref:Helicase/secretion neighborhood TadE-like protein n=2 Tax=Sanguibacter gelidistatuariae TaxID=1814289 RepID=A0A1G6HKS4_9MICO|nr:helicase/secretion neighborhood TadE-like protein [Sanguibacter gelidistatuariae]